MTTAPASADRLSYPPVSVVMPVRNEERHLSAAVARVLDQEYPGELELIVSIGPSKDRTHRIAEELAAADPRVRIVDNPDGWTPAGLNRAIEVARHDIIVRVDGHGELTPGYITTAVELIEETGAANVGGFMDAQGDSTFERAVATAYTSRLGLGGGAFHLATSHEGPADTVYLGTFRRDALAKVGGFDETMHRAQDWELNYRLRRAGEQIWFSPELRVTYRPRSTWVSLAKQFYNTGRWRREVVRRHPETASLRYLAPPMTVLGLGVGSTAGLAGLMRRAAGRRGFFSVLLMLGFLAPLVYGTVVVAGAASLRRPLPPKVRALLPAVLVVMHLSWGLGFLVGLSRR
ncbi:glycosyltransferase family 2 protein [Enemella sp. A6]|uniref:glycosyltransferase family 2 protein n=1 Tax=Enemella sp. A6 TaxID=3440152 RepID=UPI003EB88A6F